MASRSPGVARRMRIMTIDGSAKPRFLASLELFVAGRGFAE